MSTIYRFKFLRAILTSNTFLDYFNLNKGKVAFQMCCKRKEQYRTGRFLSSVLSVQLVLSSVYNIYVLATRKIMPLKCLSITHG